MPFRKGSISFVSQLQFLKIKLDILLFILMEQEHLTKGTISSPFSVALCLSVKGSQYFLEQIWMGLQDNGGMSLLFILLMEVDFSEELVTSLKYVIFTHWVSRVCTLLRLWEKFWTCTINAAEHSICTRETNQNCKPWFMKLICFS